MTLQKSVTSTYQRRRVVVTGMGALTPLGNSVTDLYQGLINGRSGVTQWKSLNITDIDCKVGGDLGEIDLRALLMGYSGKIPDQKLSGLKKMFRSATFASKTAALATLEALVDAKLEEGPPDTFRTSILIAGHNFNHEYILDNNLRFREDSSSMDPLCGIEALDSNIAASMSEVVGSRGPLSMVGGACASGNLALRDGMRDITSGECDIAVVVGPAFDITAPDIQSMAYLGAVVTDTGLQADPTKASRPFDSRRSGFIPSHGSGTIVLEEYEHAKARNATIYAEILAVRSSCDGTRLPSPSGANQARLIQALLHDAKKDPSEVGYVNCHATSTKVGDLAEIEALELAFGSHAKNLLLNAPKSMLGHLTWSAAIVELIGGIVQMNEGMVHPSINIDELDPLIHLDVCANEARKYEFDCFLKNSFGFGGHNCCSLIGKL